MRNRFILHSHRIPGVNGFFDPALEECLDEAGLPYFGRVLHHLDQLIGHSDLTFFVTTDNVSDLPETGRGVISCILEDESCREVEYRDAVDAVFRCYPSLPAHASGIRGWRPVHRTVSSIVAMREFLKGTKGRMCTLRAKLKGRTLAPVMEIPIGCHAYESEPVSYVPFSERSCDLFFQGSISHLAEQEATSMMARLRPKSRERIQMKEGLEVLEKLQPDIQVHQQFTGSFEESVSAGGASYLEQMMNAKFCLTPRGGLPHTFRFFEALRYGTFPIGETFPPSFEGAPFVRLKRWKELPEVLPRLLEDREKLQQMHEDALVWWREKASEKIVARQMAARLEQWNLVSP
jgi:hypothetical protein